MEVWRPEVIEGRRPEVLSGRNIVFAIAIHAAVFAGLYVFACLHGLFNKEEEIIPIDLTVVVNENLDGKENEPPPLAKPKPPEPKPKPKPTRKAVKKQKDSSIDDIMEKLKSDPKLLAKVKKML